MKRGVFSYLSVTLLSILFSFKLVSAATFGEFIGGFFLGANRTVQAMLASPGFFAFIGLIVIWIFLYSILDLILGWILTNSQIMQDEEKKKKFERGIKAIAFLVAIGLLVIGRNNTAAFLNAIKSFSFTAISFVMFAFTLVLMWRFISWLWNHPDMELENHGVLRFFLYVPATLIWGHLIYVSVVGWLATGMGLINANQSVSDLAVNNPLLGIFSDANFLYSNLLIFVIALIMFVTYKMGSKALEATKTAYNNLDPIEKSPILAGTKKLGVVTAEAASAAASGVQNKATNWLQGNGPKLILQLNNDLRDYLDHLSKSAQALLTAEKSTKKLLRSKLSFDSSVTPGIQDRINNLWMRVSSSYNPQKITADLKHVEADVETIKKNIGAKVDELVNDDFFIRAKTLNGNMLRGKTKQIINEINDFKRNDLTNSFHKIDADINMLEQDLKVLIKELENIVLKLNNDFFTQVKNPNSIKLGTRKGKAITKYLSNEVEALKKLYQALEKYKI